MTKSLPERWGELSGAICLKTLVLQGNDRATPRNCSENSLVLFVRCFWLCGSFLAPDRLSKSKGRGSDAPKFAPSHRGSDQPYRNKHTQICDLSLGMNLSKVGPTQTGLCNFAWVCHTRWTFGSQVVLQCLLVAFGEVHSAACREEHSMDRYRCRPELSERFGSHCQDDEKGGGGVSLRG